MSIPQYLYPGVYIEEGSSGTKSIAGVSTSVAGFVGRTEHIRKAGLDNDDMLDKPVLIQSWNGFMEKFGKYNKRQAPYLPPAVKGFFDNGGRKCYVVRVRGDSGDKDFIGAKRRRKKTGLQALCAVDEISIVCIPGATSPSVQQAMISHCETMGDRVCILDSEKNADVNAVSTQRNTLNSPGGHGVLYYPWIRVAIESGKRHVHDFVPPCGHIAGVYARTDSRGGVHKAPANAVVRGTLGLKVSVTKNEQDILNPKGINCIRAFPNRGFLVWGARTLSDDTEWKYVNVRRLLLYLEESIRKGTQWAVFEPNSEALWADVRRAVEDFLIRVWRNGMLQGAKPEEAFFVKCDLSTMTQNDIDNGELVCVAGVAPVRPAEFLIFSIRQKTT
jgi:phage tail sheath protein FI